MVLDKEDKEKDFIKLNLDLEKDEFLNLGLDKDQWYIMGLVDIGWLRGQVTIRPGEQQGLGLRFFKIKSGSLERFGKV